MKRTVTALSIVLLLAAGCAKRPEDVVAQYQSPAKYASLSCSQLAGELERVSSRVARVSDQQDRQRRNDQIATGVGVVLFWPALFFLATGDEKAELARLKGEYEAMDTVYMQKRCTSRIATAY